MSNTETLNHYQGLLKLYRRRLFKLQEEKARGSLSIAEAMELEDIEQEIDKYTTIVEALEAGKPQPVAVQPVEVSKISIKDRYFYRVDFGLCSFIDCDFTGATIKEGTWRASNFENVNLKTVATWKNVRVPNQRGMDKIDHRLGYTDDSPKP